MKMMELTYEQMAEETELPLDVVRKMMQKTIDTVRLIEIGAWDAEKGKPKRMAKAHLLKAVVKKTPPTQFSAEQKSRIVERMQQIVSEGEPLRVGYADLAEELGLKFDAVERYWQRNRNKLAE